MISVLIFHAFYCRNVAKEILKHENWRKCLRNPTMDGRTLQTTPFRKLIEAMPGYIFNIIIYRICLLYLLINIVQLRFVILQMININFKVF